MATKEQVDELLAECGAVLERDKKHEVWRLPNGQKFTRSKTPSDRRAELENLQDLKRALGLTKTVATVGERREKKATNGKAKEKVKYSRAPCGATIAQQLSGVREQSLQAEVQRLETETRKQAAQTARLLEQYRQLQDQAATCRLCRLRKWWHKHQDANTSASDGSAE